MERTFFQYTLELLHAYDRSRRLAGGPVLDEDVRRMIWLHALEASKANGHRQEVKERVHLRPESITAMLVALPIHYRTNLPPYVRPVDRDPHAVPRRVPQATGPLLRPTRPPTVCVR